MQIEDRQEFVKVLTGMAAIKRVDLTTEAFELWWNCMQDWNIDDFCGAASYLLKNCQFMPQPNDFEDIRKKQRPSAHEAWAGALEFASGDWRRGDHKDKQIDSVVRALGGWSVIALCNIDKLGFMERRFIETYNDFSDGVDVRGALPDMTTTKRVGGPVRVGELVKQVAP